MNRRAADHPWDTRVRLAVAVLLAAVLAWSIYAEGLHELSDLKLLGLAGLIGACLKLNLVPLYRMLPKGRQDDER